MVIGALLVPCSVTVTIIIISLITIEEKIKPLVLIAMVKFIYNTNLQPIPQKQWYTEPLFITLFGGLLPFASFFIEV